VRGVETARTGGASGQCVCRAGALGAGQQAVAEKSNEITAIPDLLRCSTWRRVVSSDAWVSESHCPNDHRCRRDYVLGLKDNIPLVRRRQLWLDTEVARGACRSGNDRERPWPIEIRRYAISSQIDWLDAKATGPDSKRGRVESTGSSAMM